MWRTPLNNDKTRNPGQGWQKTLAFTPIILLIVSTAIFTIFRSSWVFEPNFLLPILNVLFLSIIPSVVAYLSWRAYKTSGAVNFLFAGCSMVAFGVASLVAGFSINLPDGQNLTVTIHNSGALLASILLAASASLTLLKSPPVFPSSHVTFYLCLSYLAVLLLISLITLAAINRIFPPFFVTGEGPTILRQVVLGAGVIFFALSSIMFAGIYSRSHPDFTFWFSLALALIIVGLCAIFLQKTVGGPLGWTGRIAQYLGCSYMFIGILSTIRISRKKNVSMINEFSRSFAYIEIMYRELFENMSSGVAVYSATANGKDFVIQDFNRAAEKMECVKKEHIIGKSVLEVFPGVKEFGLFDVFQRVWRTGQAEHLPVALYCDERISGWKENYVYKLPSGEVVAVYDDVTERKKIEEKLKGSEVRYRRLFETAQDAILILDGKTGLIIDANPFIKDLLEYSMEELLGKNLWEIGTFKDIAASKTAYDEMQQKGYIRYEHLPLQTKDGRRVDVEVVANKYKVGHHDVFQCNIRDISARKKAEKALHESQELLIEIQKISKLGGWELDVPTGMITWTEATYGIYGVSFDFDPNDIPSAMSFYAPDSRRILEQAFQRALEKGESYDLELEFINAKGEHLWVRTMGRPSVIDGKVVKISGNIMDITERRAIEESLRETNELLSLFIKYSPIYAFIKNVTPTESRVLKASENYQDMIGIPGSKMAGKTMEELFPPEFAAKMTSDDWAVVSGGKVLNADEDFNNRNYTTIKFPINLGQKNLLAGYTIDVTDRKRAELEVRESEKRLRQLAEQSRTFIWEVDKEGLYTYISQAVEQIIGYRPDEVTGRKHFYDLHPEEGRDMFKAAAFEVFRRKEPFLGLDNLIRTKDGRVMWVSTNGIPLLNADGTLRGYQGSDTDITERKLLEDELKLESQLLDNTTEFIFLREWDKGGTIIYANDMMARSLGYSKEELMTMRLSQLVIPEDASQVLRWKNEVIEKVVSVYETIFKCKDGTEMPAEIRNRRIKLGTKDLVLSSGRDIAEHKKLEEEQQKLAKLESVGLLAGGIAHDFNNILTAIIGNISLVKMGITEDSKLFETLAEAEKASLRAKDLTQQLLTFAKGGAPVKKLTSIAGLVVDSASFALRGSNVKCQFLIPDDLWNAEIDGGQVSQVINNLIINAQQAMPVGGTIQVQAENIHITRGRHFLLESGDYIELSISDHGVGIPEELLPKIFDPYFTTKQKGSGLGLTGAYSIIKNHNGLITVESKVGIGTTFHIYLPASKKRISEKKIRVEKPAVVNKKILVMDDDESIREVAGRLLKHIGYDDVKFARDGDEAIKLYKEARGAGKPFGVVIMDLTIPGGKGGKETIRELLEIDPQAKAIVSSGYANDPIMSKFKKYGFMGVVAKPYTIEELRRTLSELNLANNKEN